MLKRVIFNIVFANDFKIFKKAFFNMFVSVIRA